MTNSTANLTLEPVCASHITCQPGILTRVSSNVFGSVANTWTARGRHLILLRSWLCRPFFLPEKKNFWSWAQDALQICTAA